MTDNESTRPLLFLDVDGPLNPYGAAPHERPQGYVTHRMRPTGWEDPSTKPLRVWLDHRHGEQLLALPYQLVWATTWMNEANEWIGPQLGLPELPFVDWPGASLQTDTRLHWKTQALVAYAAGRPFAWVDDELGPVDRDWVAAHGDSPALLHWVSPRLGLLPDDFATLARWAAGLRGEV
ncbi:MULTISPECIES: hypothetical protein [unclassified Streptomyces]|uniref:hypothetical protein n=1 Tax=unclassified Streptomyces TaxID=2593676 RepID=UPI002024C502|nr:MULTISPECIES: hypothetical protein [unclassified Streptomyces]MCX4552684.1 hypothetical protein [Streptomyces sp. NBC_01500]WSC24024.1 hypothetical protein OIE60_32535 [Streptomyces sp. NBC_01766]WSV57907.1 hypothetical protein OG282_31800 [Streptomyces sp. NBC_01014]